MLNINKKLLTLFLLTCNIFIAGNLVNAANVNGTLEITGCSVNCLTLTVPNNLNLHNKQYFDNTDQNIYLYGNYNLGEEIKINNVIDNVGFSLSVKSNNLISTEDNSYKLPYSKIGILTFNNSNPESIDMIRNDNSIPIQSEIDPVIKGETAEPFDYNKLLDNIEDQIDMTNYYTYFSGANPNLSDDIAIINQTPQDDNSKGSFEMGVSLLFQIPQDAIDDGLLIESDYNGGITFTLIQYP